MQVVERDLPPPAAGETRIKVLAAPVCAPDVSSRYGQTPFPPKMPFSPGYAFVGVVDMLGVGVTNLAVGDRVAALTAYGSYSEYINWDAKKLIESPKRWTQQR